jgi:DNA topoisomerase-2
VKNNKNNTITISDFLSTEYKDFSIYTIEHRALPSLVDGFKPSQRKIIHISSNVWKNGSEKTKKIFQLSGLVADQAFYHHGSSSLDNATITMVQKFKNNLPLLEEDGIFGTLRSPYAGAPRYIGTKLSPVFYEIFKDFSLMEYKVEEGVQIEPKFFLPIIPMLLINGQSGIAVGFSTNILNRNPIVLCILSYYLYKYHGVSTIL